MCVCQCHCDPVGVLTLCVPVCLGVFLSMCMFFLVCLVDSTFVCFVCCSLLDSTSCLMIDVCVPAVIRLWLLARECVYPCIKQKSRFSRTKILDST